MAWLLNTRSPRATAFDHARWTLTSASPLARTAGPGGPTGATGNVFVNLPSRPQQTTFVMSPATPGAALTVPLVVTDSCGAWPTFVGAGPNAGPDAGLAATPSPSAGASAA